MKLKFGIKSIFKYLYVIILLVNFFLIYQIYSFTKTNVLSAINPGDALMHLQNRKFSEDLNIKKFDEIISKIKQKRTNFVDPTKAQIPDLNKSTSSPDEL